MLSSFIGVRKGLFVFGAHFYGERKVATNTGRLSADLESTNRSTKETRRTKLRHVPARFERSNKWSSNCFGKTHAYSAGVSFKKSSFPLTLLRAARLARTAQKLRSRAAAVRPLWLCAVRNTPMSIRAEDACTIWDPEGESIPAKIVVRLLQINSVH